MWSWCGHRGSVRWPTRFALRLGRRMQVTKGFRCCPKKCPECRFWISLHHFHSQCFKVGGGNVRGEHISSSVAWADIKPNPQPLIIALENGICPKMLEIITFAGHSIGFGMQSKHSSNMNLNRFQTRLTERSEVIGRRPTIDDRCELASLVASQSACRTRIGVIL
jgi:hypothetical protein